MQARHPVRCPQLWSLNLFNECGRCLIFNLIGRLKGILFIFVLMLIIHYFVPFPILSCKYLLKFNVLLVYFLENTFENQCLISLQASHPLFICAKEYRHQGISGTDY